MNRDAARARLAVLLREAIAPPPPPRVPTKPTRGAKERRLEGKRRRAQISAIAATTPAARISQWGATA